MKSLRVPLKISLYVGIVILAANVVRIELPRLRAHATSVEPHTVVLAETIVHPDERRQPGPNQLWALRSDGSMVLKFGSANTGSRKIRFASGMKVSTNDKLRAKSTTRGRLDDSWALDPRENCTKTITGFQKSNQSGPVEEVVKGYRTLKISRGSTSRWYAPEYGCALVKQHVDFGELGSSELELVTLIAGEPSPTLFAAGKDYKEGPPSALAPVNCDGACGEQQKAHFERLDTAYFTHRVQ